MSKFSSRFKRTLQQGLLIESHKFPISGILMNVWSFYLTIRWAQFCPVKLSTIKANQGILLSLANVQCKAHPEHRVLRGA